MRQACRLLLFDAKIRASIRVSYTRITDGSTPITEYFLRRFVWITGKALYQLSVRKGMTGRFR